MGSAGSMLPAGASLVDGAAMSLRASELRQRYSRQLRLPVDASDLHAPDSATPEQMSQALERAKAEVLFLRAELFRLSSSPLQVGTISAAAAAAATASEERKVGSHIATAANQQPVFDLRSLEGICSGCSDADDLRECIAFVAHIRKLLQRETAMEKRRVRRPSNEGRRLIPSAMLASDSDTDSDDGLEDLL